MTKQIWKYQATFQGTVEIELPLGSEVLSAGYQAAFPDKIAIWAIVDTEESISVVTRFHIRKTGLTFDGREGKLINLISIDDGRLIFHVFHDKGHSDD